MISHVEFLGYPRRLKQILSNPLTLDEQIGAHGAFVDDNVYKENKFLNGVQVYFGYCQDLQELNDAANNILPILIEEGYMKLQNDVNTIFENQKFHLENKNVRNLGNNNRNKTQAQIPIKNGIPDKTHNGEISKETKIILIASLLIAFGAAYFGVYLQFHPEYFHKAEVNKSEGVKTKADKIKSTVDLPLFKPVNVTKNKVTDTPSQR